MDEPSPIERLADRAHAPVHHVGRCDDIAAGLSLDHSLPLQDLNGLVVGDVAVPDDPVMAVRGERVERHVAQHAEFGQSLFQSCDRAADKIARVERVAAFRIFQRRRHRRKDSHHRNA